MKEMRACERCGAYRRNEYAQHNFCAKCRMRQGTELVLPGEWVDDALCAKSPNPDAWYSDRPTLVRYAMDHCAACPVRRECRDYAMKAVETRGIWGMTTAAHRRATRRGKAA